MPRTAHALPADEVVDVDLCIVGAGPAGLTLAYELADSGLRIAVVERGPATPPGVPRATGIARGLPYPLAETVSSGAGGTARLWCIETPDGPDHVRFRELDPEDVDGRPKIGLDPWPITHAEIATWYPRARGIVGLPPAPPESVTDPLMAATHRRIRATVFEFPQKSVFVTRLPEALADTANVRIYFDSRVVGIDAAGEPGRIAGVTVETDSRPGRWRLRARATVLAAGAVENAALLLAARNGWDLNAETASHVGIGFMEHLHFSAGILVPRSRTLLSNAALAGFERIDGRVVERRHLLSPELEDLHGLPRCTVKLVRAPYSRAVAVRAFGAGTSRGVQAARDLRASLRRGSPAALARDLGTMVRDARAVLRHLAVSVGWRLWRLSPASRRQVFLLVAVAEQRRNPASRVHVSGQDDVAPSEARVEQQIRSDDVRALHSMLRVLDDELSAAGIGRVHPFFAPGELPSDLGWGHHHLGTTVMSDSAKNGVVDRDLRVHGTQNLYVAGSSVFPSGGHANPTLTLIALSCRLADHLRRRLRG